MIEIQIIRENKDNEIETKLVNEIRNLLYEEIHRKRAFIKIKVLDYIL